jgi:acyl-CoA synthetase (AMP-forming)/AMP-acid ligase II
MLGRMMDRPLLISSLIEHAAANHGDTEIVSRSVEGPIHRTTYAEANRRAKKLAKGLSKLGVGFGDRVATLAWNGFRHFELYYAISGIGAVCHTINPRLFADQLVYIFNHADDRVLFVDLTFLPLVEKLAPQLPKLKHIVAMTDRAHMPATTALPDLLCYEELVAAEDDGLVWPDFDEKTASSLCYTSGTTGNPKGSLYTHRSTVLHAMMGCNADVLAFSSRDAICPIVPMFHVNAWGVPYAGTMAGSKLVFPGPALDGASLAKLFNEEGVTVTLGVPTIWAGLLKHMADTGSRFATLKRLLVGGSAAPPSMIEAFGRHGVEALHGWGMTEMSPLGTVCTLKGKHLALPEEKKAEIRVKQGRVLYGVEMKIVDAAGTRLPQDGVAVGELLVRGPWIIAGYFADEAASAAAFDEEGWFRTGDVCTLDPDGYVQVTDRRKDVIKSGGEWISSIDVENLAVGHPEVQEAAVIGLPHAKWGERPLLIVVAKDGASPTREALLDYLSDKLAKWMMPDDVVFVKELPHTATGKLLKTRLREDFKGHRLPGA